MMILLFLFGLGCGGAGDGGCEQLCLEQEQVWIDAVAGGPDGGSLDTTAYRAMCADAAGADCEACNVAIGAYMQAEHLIAPDCGCGFSAEAIGECRGAEVSESEAADVVTNCEETCAVYGL